MIHGLSSENAPAIINLHASWLKQAYAKAFRRVRTLTIINYCFLTYA